MRPKLLPLSRGPDQAPWRSDPGWWRTKPSDSGLSWLIKTAAWLALKGLRSMCEPDDYETSSLCSPQLTRSPLVSLLSTIDSPKPKNRTHLLEKWLKHVFWSVAAAREFSPLFAVVKPAQLVLLLHSNKQSSTSGPPHSSPASRQTRVGYSCAVDGSWQRYHLPACRLVSIYQINRVIPQKWALKIRRPRKQFLRFPKG